MKKWTKWVLVLMMGIMLSSVTPMVYAEDTTSSSEVTSEVTASPDTEEVPTEVTATPDAEEATTLEAEVVDTGDTVDPEASIDPRIMESSAVEDGLEPEAVQKTVTLAEESKNDVTKTSTKETAALFSVIGGLVVWLVGYRIHASKKQSK